MGYRASVGCCLRERQRDRANCTPRPQKSCKTRGRRRPKARLNRDSVCSFYLTTACIWTIDIIVKSDRCFLGFIRLLSALVFLWSVTPSVRADDTWHNIYHSLKRFFTGDSGSNQSPRHRPKRSANREKTDRSLDSISAAGDGSPQPAASAKPRVVVLPAASPAAESTQPTLLSSPAKETEPAAKPEASPNLTPVLRSLPVPSPGGSPIVLPSTSLETSAAF